MTFVYLITTNLLPIRQIPYIKTLGVHFNHCDRFFEGINRCDVFCMWELINPKLIYELKVSSKIIYYTDENIEHTDIIILDTKHYVFLCFQFL